MPATNESKGLALARGFIVLVMPAVHTTLLYSTSEVKNGPLGIVLGFLAEQPGAQLFMFLMGLFVAYGRRKDHRQVFVRVIRLIIAAYLLNALRLVLPFYWGWLPKEFLAANGVVIDEFTPIRLLLIGDILQLAAIAYLACWTILQVKHKMLTSLIALLLVLLLSPQAWQIQTNNPLLEIPLDLLTGRPPKTFFPVFPWICYPLAGLLAASLWEKTKLAMKKVAWLISAALLIAGGWALTIIEPSQWHNSFYRLGPGGTLLHMGVVLLWIAVFVWLAVKSPDNAFFRLLNWLSTNITIIYLTQWIVVMWLLPVFGYAELSLGQSLLAISLTSMISFSIPVLYHKTIPSPKTI